MTDKSEPAFPGPVQFSDYDATIIGEGLTKREYFAALAMQGLFASEIVTQAISEESSNTGFNTLMARAACSMADALIEELNK